MRLYHSARLQTSNNWTGFRFLSFMVDMPKSCENCRLRLIIEYNRLLAWGDTVGLIEVANDSTIAASLGTNSTELSGIIYRIVSLLEQFNILGERWKELGPRAGTGSNQAQTESEKIDELQGMLKLDAAYLKSSEKRRRIKGTNHLTRWIEKSVDGAKEVASHPRRIRWAAVDKDAFEALLQDLHALTERLHELVNDFNLRKIVETTSETYRELVLARNDVQELRDMLAAVTAFIQTPTTPSRTMPKWRHSIDEEFRHLLQLKEINRRGDFLLARIEKGGSVQIDGDWRDWENLITVRKYDGTTLDQYFQYASIDNSGDDSQMVRARGSLKIDDKALQAWVEWRHNGTIQIASERIRVMALAQMLHAAKPKSLFAPTCLGYIDDTAAHGRFGWIFALPSLKPTSTLRSLHSILGDVRYRPTLSQRVALASKLATSLLHLHTCDWLHKGFHSGNVIFSFEGNEYDPGEPIVSGFDFSRSQSSRTISGSFEPRWDMYRWPSIQNEAPKAASSRKTYDIYSLGLVLLEIAHWKPLSEVMCLDELENSSHNAWIRAWLLGEDDPPFDSNPLLMLRDIAGDRYWKAVNRCVEAHGTEGLQVEEHADQAWSASMGIRIQNNFNRFVVQQLREVSI